VHRHAWGLGLTNDGHFDIRDVHPNLLVQRRRTHTHSGKASGVSSIFEPSPSTELLVAYREFLPGQIGCLIGAKPRDNTSGFARVGELFARELADLV
jgi:hypothetical protein